MGASVKLRPISGAGSAAMDIRLDGRLAAVTGAGGDIGFASAKLFAEAGARLVLLEQEPERLRRALAAIQAVSPDSRGYRCDVSSAGEVATVFAAVRAEAGDIDILFNNAGICPSARFADIGVDDWDRVMNVNARSVFLCTREALPAMRAKRYGRVINNASQVAHRGGPMLTHYAASKAAILAFTHSLAHEVAAEGVAVNAICPGPIRTRLMDGVPQGRIDATIAELPIGRLGRPDEVAAAVLFLASDQASFFTGSSLNMNGGHYMI
jgi:3-oxoacyl-[acyl-carrier protein] reductase